MTINTTSNLKLSVLFLMFFLFLSQVNYSQKNNQNVLINKDSKVLPKIANANCDCDKIDFSARVIKLSSTPLKTVYKLQLIDFRNPNKCDVKFLNFNWKDHISVPFSTMKNQKTEHLPDGSLSLYEFNFETKTYKEEPEDASQIITSFGLLIGKKNCLFENQYSLYYSHF